MAVQPLNNATGALASDHLVGSGTLALKSGEGARFGTPTPDSPVRVTVARLPTMISSRIESTTTKTIFDCTARTGDTLSGLTAVEGTSDQRFYKNDPVAALITAGTLSELQTVVTDAATVATDAADVATEAAAAVAGKADDDAVVHDTGDETIAGVKTFSDNLVIGGTLTVGPLGTIQFVDTGEGNASLSGQNIFAFDSDEFWVRAADETNMAKFIKAVETIFFFYPLVLPEVADADIFNGGIAWSLTNPGTLKARKPDGTLITLGS